MKKVFHFVLVMAACLCADVSFGAEVVKIAGSGGMIPLVTELAKSFMAENQGAVVMVNQQSIQSAGGIQGAANGELGIGMANRPLKDEEKVLGLEVIEIANARVIIGVNKSISLDNLSSEDLCKIYEGKITTWDELKSGSGPIVALTKPETDATKETIRKAIPCFKNLKESEKIITIKTSVDMADALAKAKAIGLTDNVSIVASRGAIKAVSLDGIAPSLDNVKAGKYKLVQAYRLVTKGKPAGAVKDFIEFVKGPKGKKIMDSMNVIAAK